MKIDFEHFKKNLPEHVLDVLSELFNKSFEPSIIGGITRDYLLDQSIGDDFDICIRPLKSTDQISEITTYLLDKYEKSEQKNYGVIDLGNGVEISFPRIEKYNNEVGHSNFEVEFIQDLDYSNDVLRRDFTLNAISFTFKDNDFILNDPLGGVDDIKNRILRVCSYQNFVKDPVRFLRAIRFHILLDFEFETNSEEIIKNMQLALTPHYLRYEAKKSLRPLTFLLMINFYQEEYLTIDFEDKNDEILDYENYLFNLDLYEHFRHAYFLSKELRVKILETFGLKTAHVWNIPFHNIDIFELAKLDLEHFPKLSYINDLLKFFDNATKIDNKLLSYFQFIHPLGPQAFINFQSASVTVPKQIEPSLRRYFIFREKLKEIL